MVKHPPSAGRKFLAREPIGRPQWIAGCLLLLLLGQCLWLISRRIQPRATDPRELARVQEGLAQWKGEGIAGTGWRSTEGNGASSPLWSGQRAEADQHSPVWYLIASLALLPISGNRELVGSELWGWLERAPHVLLCLLLGSSVWYVSRRLYGNAGGYVALSLYCFSPTVIRSSALWLLPPEMSAALGAFGAIFTAVAVSHTLYAPREVVLWNWRRIGLLGFSFWLAIGSQFSLSLLVPLALTLMLYLAPMRRRAAALIWASACSLAVLLLCASYGFHIGIFRKALGSAQLVCFSRQAFVMTEAYARAGKQFGDDGPALLILLPLALLAFLAWPRCRYFGNTLPLATSLLFIFLGIAAPHYPGLGFELVAAPFLFVFVAGVSADLMDTERGDWVKICLASLLIANALWNLLALAHVSRAG